MMSYLCLYVVLFCLLVTMVQSGSSAALTPSGNVPTCDDHGHCVDFPTHRYMLHRYFPIADTRHTQRLNLAAAGLRKKKVVLLEVEVYKVGLYLSFEKEEHLYHRKAQQQFQLLDLALSLPENPTDEHVSMAIVLTFVRDVSKEQVVQALVDVLSNKYQTGDSDTAKGYTNAVTHFAQQLQQGFGDKSGIKTSQEIVFTFLGRDNHTVRIYLDDHFVGQIEHALLRQCLAEIYIGEESVAKDVHLTLLRKF